MKSKKLNIEIENSQNEEKPEENPLILFEKKKTQSKNSHSKSISVDQSISSRKKNPFVQSFDSKLSEFSDNADVFDLNVKKTIDEYTGEEISVSKKFNSIGKNLGNSFKNSKVRNFEQNTKNFTFSRNQHDHQILSNERKINLNIDEIEGIEEKNSQVNKGNFNNKIKKGLNLEFGFDSNNSSKREINDSNKEIDEDDDEYKSDSEEESVNNENFDVKISGSSLNQPFLKQSNIPNHLNAPKNKKKISFNFQTAFVQKNNNNKMGLEILIPEEEEEDSKSDSNSISENNNNQDLKILSHFSNSHNQSLNKKSSSTNNEKISSNSPKSCSQINNSFKDSQFSKNKTHSKMTNEIPSSKNVEISYKPVTSNFDLGMKSNFFDPFGGSKTNPLPTCKNANQKKHGGFFLGGAKRKVKKTLSINVQHEKETKNFDLTENNNMKNDFITEEDSNEEYNSNQNNKTFEPKKTKRNIKIKINSKQSNHSKPESVKINSIQKSNFIISPKCGISHLHKSNMNNQIDSENEMKNNQIKSIETFSKHGSDQDFEFKPLIKKIQITSDKNIKNKFVLENSDNQIKSSKLTEKQPNSEVKRFKISKKASAISGNKSSLMSSGFGYSDSNKKQILNFEETDNEIVKSLKSQLEKEEKRVIKIQQDAKRRTDAYKRICDNQRIRIKELEQSISKMNKEKNELKKDQKVMNELNNFLQRRIHFLEENQKNISKNISIQKKNTSKTFFDEPESKDLQIFSHVQNENNLHISPEMDSPMWQKSIEFQEYHPHNNSIINSHEKERKKNLKRKMNIIPKEFKNEHFSFNKNNKNEKKNLMIDIVEDDEIYEFNETVKSPKQSKSKKKKLEIMIPEEQEQNSSNNNSNLNSSRNQSYKQQQKNNFDDNSFSRTKNFKQSSQNQQTMKLSINVPENQPVIYQVKSTKINKKIYFDDVDQNMNFKKTHNFEKNKKFNQLKNFTKKSKKQIHIPSKIPQKAKKKEKIAKTFSNTYIPFEKSGTNLQQIYTSHNRIKKMNIQNNYLNSNRKSKKKEDFRLFDLNKPKKKTNQTKKKKKNENNSKIISIDIDSEPISARIQYSKNKNVIETPHFLRNEDMNSHQEKKLNIHRIKTEPLLKNSTDEYFESSHQFEEDEGEKFILFNKSSSGIDRNNQFFKKSLKEPIQFSDFQENSISTKKSNKSKHKNSHRRRKIKSNFNNNFNISSNIKKKRKTENLKTQSKINDFYENFSHSKKISKNLSSKSPLKKNIYFQKLLNKDFTNIKNDKIIQKPFKNSSLSKKYTKQKYNFEKKPSEKIFSIKNDQKKNKVSNNYKSKLRSEYLKNYQFNNYSSKVNLVGQKEKKIQKNNEFPLKVFSNEKIIGEKKKKIKQSLKRQSNIIQTSLFNKSETNSNSIWKHKKNEFNKSNPQSHQLLKIVNSITIDKNMSRKSSQEKINFEQIKKLNVRSPLINNTQEFKKKNNHKYFSVQSMKKDPKRSEQQEFDPQQFDQNNFNSKKGIDAYDISIFDTDNFKSSSRK